MFRRVILLLALPMAGAVAQSTDLTVEINKVPVGPKMFTVVAVDSSVFVSVRVTQNNQTVLSGTGAYVRIQTGADQRVHLDSGAGRPSFPPPTEYKIGSRPQ